MNLRTLVVGPVSCNCAIVACPETGEAAVIDPGGDGDVILAAIKDMGVTVKYLLHTHGHFDHIMATGELAAATGAPILLHQSDRPIYEGLPRQARIFGFEAVAPPAVSEWLRDGQVLGIGTLSVQVLHTPGHTPGSVSLYFGSQEALVFAGDTLFAHSVGRTDLPGGSLEDLQKSIRTKLYTLPVATRVIPGHGRETLIGHELQHNPYVTALPANASP